MINNSARAVKTYTYSLLAVVGGFSASATLMSVLMNDIVGEFKLIGASQGMMNSMISLGFIIALASTVILQGRIKKSVMIAASALIIALTMICVGLSPTFVLLLISCIVLGIGGGWVDSYSNSSIIDVNRENSARYSGALHGWFGVGGLLTPIIISTIMPGLSWRGVYLAFSPLVLAMTLQFFFVSKRNEEHIDLSNVNEPKLKARELGQYLTHKRNLLLLLAVVTYSAQQAGFLCYIVYYMSASFGEAELGASCVSILWLFSTVSRFIAPRLNARPIVLHTFGALAAGAVLVAGVLAKTPVIMCVASGLVGLTSGHCLPMLINECVANYRERTLLPTTAVLLFTKIAAMVMPVIMGAIGFFSLTASMALPGIASILSGITGFLILRTKHF